jgi:5-methylcytosine-specific restriction endonuclease McrA
MKFYKYKDAAIRRLLKEREAEKIKQIEEDKKWVAENQRYDILAIYGQVRMKQNLCRRCNSRFFVLSKADDSPYCPDCRIDIKEEKEDSNKLQIIFHTAVERVRPSISKKIRMAVYERDSYTCVYCDRDLHYDFENRTGQISLDHFIPYIGRGEDQIKNLYTACKRCNVAKFSKIFKSVQEVREYIAGRESIPVEVLVK